MANPYHHAVASARKYGGIWQDYIEIHHWFDASKAFMPDARHRALRHHSQGIFECEKHFGRVLINSDQKEIPVRFIGEQHVQDDMAGRIPSLEDWFKCMTMEPWMVRGARNLSKELENDKPEGASNRPDDGSGRLPIPDNYKEKK